MRNSRPGAGDWRRWPADLRDPASATVAVFAASRRDEVLFHVFLQWLADRSLAAAQQRARESGMRIGLISDLAVGMDPDRQPCVEPAGRHSGRPDHRCAAGSVQSARAGLGPDRVLAARPDRRRLRAVPGDRARGAASHRRPAHRPRHGPGAALADAGRRARRRMAPIWPIRLPTCCGCWPWNRSGIRRSSSARTSARCRTVSARRWRRPACTACACCGSSARARHLPRRIDWDHSAIAMTSTHDLPTVAGWWHGTDIATRAACGRLGEGVSEADAVGRTRRGSCRAVAGLRAGGRGGRRGAAAGGYTTAWWMPRLRSSHARTSPLCLLPGRGCARPGGAAEPARHGGRASELAAAAAGRCRVDPGYAGCRGTGGAPGGEAASAMTAPRATMRLQLHSGFTFADADASGAVPRLLGISHVYTHRRS